MLGVIDKILPENFIYKQHIFEIRQIKLYIYIELWNIAINKNGKEMFMLRGFCYE